MQSIPTQRQNVSESALRTFVFMTPLNQRVPGSSPGAPTRRFPLRLLFSGIVGLITTIRMRQAPGFWWALVSAILGIAAGIVLLIWPLSGILSLTLILIVFFVIEGVTSIMFALEHKRELSGQWAWMLVSGIVDLILAAIILAGLPGTAAWTLGLLVGINMIFGGSALVAMALHARK